MHKVVFTELHVHVCRVYVATLTLHTRTYYNNKVKQFCLNLLDVNKNIMCSILNKLKLGKPHSSTAYLT